VQVDLAGDVDFVLDRDRHAEQRPVVPGAPPRLGLLGFQHRLVGENLAEGVQLRIEAIDPFQRLADQLGRADFAGTHHLGLPGKPQEREIISPLRHAAILLGPPRLSPGDSETTEPAFDPSNCRFIVQVCISAVILAAGFGVLLFGTGEQSGTTLASGGVGVIFGFWMRR